jgi:K+-sensing histidine kinase KdpD
MAHADIIATDKPEPSFGASGSAVMQYLATFILTVFASAIAVGVDSRIAIPNVSMVYVVPVVIAGAAFGVGPSLFAAVLGALSYNFFLTEPRYTLTVDDPANIWAIALLFLVGMIVSGVAFVLRRKTSEAAELQRRAVLLQRLSGDIADADPGRAAALTSGALAAMFDAPAVVLAAQNGRLDVMQITGAAELQQAEWDAASSAFATRSAVRGGVYPDLQSRFDFWPVGADGQIRAVIGVAFPGDDRPSQPDLSIDVVRSLLALAMTRSA